MKRTFYGLLLLLPLTAAVAQSPEGTWTSTLDLPGLKLDMSLDLRLEDNIWKGDLDVPLQQIKDMPVSDLAIQGTTLSFKLPEVPGDAGYTGQIKSGDAIEGTFSQGGQKLPLNWTRQSAAAKIAEITRLKEAIAALEVLTDSFMVLRNTPGLAFGIIKDGEILLAKGFGYRDYENKVKTTAHTQFAIGSSTKAFTAACVALLVKEGKIEWDRPVIHYMPDFQLFDDFATKEMTAIDLMCHRSGLPRHDMMWYGSLSTRKEIYDRLRFLKPNKSFRSTWQYNNLMFMTAGMLVEKMSGQTWETFLHDRIFLPLGMTNSNTSVSVMQKANDFAFPYQNEEKVITRMAFRDIDAIGPAGSINASVTDMLQWVRFQLDEGAWQGQERIDQTDMQMMHQPHMLMDASTVAGDPEISHPAYGLGWFTYQYRGHRIVEHGGNIDGFSALVYLIPESDIGIVILTNQNGAGIPDVLSKCAADLLLDLEPIDWYVRKYGTPEKEKEEKEKKKKETEAQAPKRIEGTRLSHPIADYAGKYEHAGYGIIQIEERNNTLEVQVNTLVLPLVHWHYDVFRMEDKMLEISFLLNFQTDDKGYISGFSAVVEPAIESQFFKKLPAQSLTDPNFLSQLAGKYAIEGQTIEILLKTGKLYASVPGQPPFELEPIQNTEFGLKGLNGYSVEFIMDKKGVVKEAKFNQPDGVHTVKRID